MNPRDIVIEQIRHHETMPIPYTLPFEEEVIDRLNAHYGNKEWRKKLTTYIAGTRVVDPLKYIPIDREGYNRDQYRSIWRMNRRPFHLETPALPEPTLEGYDWPLIEEFLADEKRVAEARAFCDERKGKCFLTSDLGWGLFETSWGIRGFENILMDAVAEPEFFAELLDRITEQVLVMLDYTCRNLPDIDAIMFGDDWGDQRGVIVGPDRWREFFKPLYARIYERAHSYGKFVITHCCGSIVDIIPDLIDMGLDVLESCQPEARGMNPYELKKEFGKNLTFWGCLGSQSTIPFGTPAEIRREVRKLRSEMGKGGGFILAPAKPVQPETPTENAITLIEVFGEQ